MVVVVTSFWTGGRGRLTSFWTVQVLVERGFLTSFWTEKLIYLRPLSSVYDAQMPSDQLVRHNWIA